jgi:hypothetical protein
LTAARALTFPAVQLFVGRAASHGSGFQLNDAEAPIVGEVCRRLDGIALALELAAGRVGVYGEREIAPNRHQGPMSQLGQKLTSREWSLLAAKRTFRRVVTSAKCREQNYGPCLEASTLPMEKRRIWRWVW